MFEVTKEAVSDAVSHTMAWFQANLFSKIDESKCPLLDRPGYLVFTLDTNQNFTVFFSDTPEKPKHFSGDPIYGDDEDYDELIELHNKYAKFSHTATTSKKELIAAICYYYGEAVVKRSALSEDGEESVIDSEYADLASFIDMFFSECVVQAQIGLCCEKYLCKDCIASSKYTCPFVPPC